MTAKKKTPEKPDRETTPTNLAIWESVQATPPSMTKAFNRGGGFKGTSANATYLAKRATEKFGPIGIGWGVNILEENYIEGAFLKKPGDMSFDLWEKIPQQKEVIHVLKVELWYKWEGADGKFIQFGQTTFVGCNKYGSFTDEEAPKKSLTDATTKCLSLLGFSADIFLGLYDNNKYVNDAKQKERGEAENGDGPGQEKQEGATAKKFTRTKNFEVNATSAEEFVSGVEGMLTHCESVDDVNEVEKQNSTGLGQLAGDNQDRHKMLVGQFANRRQFFHDAPLKEPDHG